jgi:ubiquinone/menaquinone biosynthesis C-methylase UbiE
MKAMGRKLSSVAEFKKFVAERFDYKAVFYEDFVEPLKEIYFSLLDLVDLESEDKVLDVGTGHGYPGIMAAERVQKGIVVGIDISPVMLKLALRNIRARKISNFVIVQGDVECLPFRKEIFDAVLCSLVLMGVPNRRLTLKEMTRVTKPGGVVVASSPRRRTWEIGSSLQQLKAFKMYISKKKPLNMKWFWHGFTVKELENLFREARLRNIKAFEKRIDLVFNDFAGFLEYLKTQPSFSKYGFDYNEFVNRLNQTDLNEFKEAISRKFADKDGLLRIPTFWVICCGIR